MTDVDLVILGAAGIVFYYAEVVIGVICFGVTGDVFEFLGISDLFLIRKVTTDSGCQLRIGIAMNFGRARTLTGKLEGVLDRAALFTCVTTFRNLTVVTGLQERQLSVAILNPEVDDRDLDVMQALGDKFLFDLLLSSDVHIFQTFGFSKFSIVIFGEYAGCGFKKWVLDRETYVCSVLERNRNR